MRRINNKKGFSIIEAVIAMAVVTIVTVAAISISSGADGNARAALNKTDAQIFAADVIECFKVTDGIDPLKAALESRGDVTVNNKSNIELECKLDQSGFTANIIVNNNNIKITVLDTKGNTVSSYDYTKGGTQ